MRGLGGRGVCDNDGSRRPRSDPPAILSRDPGRHETPWSPRRIETLHRMGEGLGRLLPKMRECVQNNAESSLQDAIKTLIGTDSNDMNALVTTNRSFRQ